MFRPDDSDNQSRPSTPSAVPVLAEIAVQEAQRVAMAAERDQALLLDDLRTWVNIDTPTGDVEQVDILGRILAQRLEAYGLRSELLEEGGNGLYLHASLLGSGRARVALLCHHDTVFPLGTASERPFRMDPSQAYGPGVADMKGGIAVAAHTARLLARGSRPFGRLEIVSVPDEELREVGAPATLDRLKGFDAVFCLECGREDGSIVSARKAAFWAQISAAGRSAHAGVCPDEGRNAVSALCREAVRLSDLHGLQEGLSLQVTSFVGGEGTNTVPSNARLTVDLRVTTMADLLWGVQEIGRFGHHTDITFHVEELSRTPPLERTQAVSRLAQAAIHLGAEVGHNFGESATGGASDGSFTAAAGLPTLDGLGPVGGRDHTPEEYVELGSFAPRCGVVAGLVAAVETGLLVGATGTLEIAEVDVRRTE